MPETLWVVGTPTPDGSWCFQGVFSTAADAEKRAKVYAAEIGPTFFAPVELDCHLPIETLPWPGLIWVREEMADG